MGNQTYEATTWEIRFLLQSVNQTGNYTLQIALASAAECELQVCASRVFLNETFFSLNIKDYFSSHYQVFKTILR